MNVAETTTARKRRLPIGRAVLSALAAGLLMYALLCFLHYRKALATYHAAEVAEIGAVDVDLSRPGRANVAVSGRYLMAHGVELVLRIGQGGEPLPDARQLPAGLAATGRCIGADGKEFAAAKVEPADLRLNGDEITLYGFGGGPDEFTFQLDITQGAPALAGLPQRLYARNGLCGMEQMVATMQAVVGGASAGVGGLLVIGVVVYTRRRRRRKQ